jgi:hypothetical protein
VTLYNGQIYRDTDVSIGAPDVAQVQPVLERSDVTDEIEYYLATRENLASRGMAIKCGFQYAGTAWEDPENLVVFDWDVPR